MCWGQAIYEYAVPGGATTSGWGFSAPSAPPSTLSSFLFRTATGAGGAGASAWVDDISLLTPAAYLNVMVRLATYLSGTDPTLTDMTFSYLGASSQPSYYTFSPSGDWTLDQGAFRYGTKSLRFNITDNTTDRVMYPFRTTAGDDIAVAPSTRYVYSCYVRTNGPLHANSDVRLQLYAAGGLTSLLAEGSVASGGAVNDTTPNAEEWARVVLPFTSLPGQTLLRPWFVTTMAVRAMATGLGRWHPVRAGRGRLAMARQCAVQRRHHRRLWPAARCHGRSHGAGSGH